MITSLIEIFQDIPDPRVERCKLHKLIDIVIITICAIICGCDSWTEIEVFGEAKQEWLESFLELPNGIPSHDTIARVFARIKPEEFQSRFIIWVENIKKKLNKEIISVDGKTLRRTHNKKAGVSAIHMVSAWANSNRMVLGQTKVGQKSNEITAIPELLQMLEISNCIITIDALGTQKEIAKVIKKQEADYVLALKGNHKNLLAEVELFFQEAEKAAYINFEGEYYQTNDQGHGRQEERKYWITAQLNWLRQTTEWEGLTSIICCQSTRVVGAKTTTEKRYYLSSLPADAKLAAHAIRSHWGIENSLHWVLDISFREDESRIRKDFAPENFAILKHFALNLLRREPSFNRGIKAKRLRAALNHDYFLKILLS